MSALAVAVIDGGTTITGELDTSANQLLACAARDGPATVPPLLLSPKLGVKVYEKATD